MTSHRLSVFLEDQVLEEKAILDALDQLPTKRRAEAIRFCAILGFQVARERGVKIPGLLFDGDEARARMPPAAEMSSSSQSAPRSRVRQITPARVEPSAPAVLQAANAEGLEQRLPEPPAALRGIRGMLELED